VLASLVEAQRHSDEPGTLARVADGRAEAVNEPLPEVLDNKRIREELGVTKAAAEKLMRQCPKTFAPPKDVLDKVYVYRADVEALLERWTSTKDEVQP
jgi:hypothetical protein